MRRTPRLARLITCLILALAISLGLSTPAPGQDSAPQPVTVPVVQEPTGVAVSQITVEAEKARESVGGLLAIAQPVPEIDELIEVFPSEEEIARRELELTDGRLQEGLSFRDLEDLSKRWGRELDRLDKRLDLTSTRAASLDEALEQLQDLRRIWETTETDGQEALQNVVNEILGLLQVVEEDLGTARARLTEIRGPLRQVRADVETVLEEINTVRESRGAQLSRPDSPRLWDHPAWDTGLMDLQSYLKQSLRYMALDLQEFAVENGETLFYHVLLILILITALYVLRHRLSHSEVDEGQVRRHSRVLQDPVATALLLGMAFMGAIYPKAPPVVMDIMVVLIFLPYLRILPEGLQASAKSFLVFIWTLFVLGRVEIFFPTDSLILRLLMLIQSLAGILVFGMAARRSYAETPHLSRRTMSIVLLVVRLSAGALILSILANLLGYTGLTRLLNTATISGAYASILLFGLNLALRGLVELLHEIPLLQKSRMLQRHGPLIRRRLTTLINWWISLWLLRIYLDLLGVQKALFDGLISVLTATAKFGELQLSLGGVLAFFITIYAASLLSRILRFVLEEDVYYRVYLPRGVPNAITTSLHYTILLAGFILAIAATGIELSKLTILAGAFGVGIGFGLQDIVKNFVSGAVLLLERPIMPGDTVQTPLLWGTVKRIGIRSSTIRTWEGAEVIVPNSDLVLSQVTNWTLSDRQRRIEVTVGVAYGTDPATVVDLLVETAKANDETLESPNPYAIFLGFGDSSLDFSLRAWTVKFDDFLRIKSELTIAVNAAIRDAGIEIAFPQRDLHLRSVDPTIQSPVGGSASISTPSPTPRRDDSSPPSRTNSSGPGDGSME